MELLDLDKKIFFLINHGSANSLFDILMPALTARGYLLLLPYLAYLFWVGNKGRKSGGVFTVRTALLAFLTAFFSFLLTDWFANEIKHIVERIRPCNALEGVRLLVGCSKSFSMPSNHATNIFAEAVPLYYFTRRHISRFWGLFPFVLAVLISYSRVYVGVHYPSDIAAGAVFGSAVSFALIHIYKYARSKYNVNPYSTTLFATLAAISLFRIYYIMHGPLDLSPDEAHYWEWSRRLDLSYYSKGPMIAYLIYTGTSIFGDNIFGIRIMAVIFSALSSLLMFRLAAVMYRERITALVSALLIQIIPLFAPFGVLFTIDSPFIFFWMLSLFLFWKAITAAQDSRVQGFQGSSDISTPADRRSMLNYWILIGVSVGLGLLTKYTMAFFYLCSFLCLLFSEKKALLKTFKPYLAFAVSLLVFSPVIIWNIRHDWVTVRHTAGQAHVAEGLNISLKNFFEFFGSQIGSVTPLIFFMMAFALYRLLKSEQDPRSKFLFYFSVPVVLFFLVKSLQGKVQANWAMTGYLTGIIAFSRYYFGRENLEFQFSNFRLVSAAIGLALLITVVAHYPSIIKLPVKMDPSARLRGWNSLGAEVGDIYKRLSAEGPVLIFSDSYQVASELAFYVTGHPQTNCINLGRRMNQYDLWPEMNEIRKQKTEDGRQINAVFVRMNDQDMPPSVSSAFDRVDKRKLLQVSEKGKPLREYSIFICYNFKGFKTVKPETY